LDRNEKGYISDENFYSLVEKIMKDSYSKEMAHSLYLKIDENNSGKISIDEFFQLIDILDEDDSLNPVKNKGI
jgi:Ca2+-binding EF-hand superfamily protein